MIPFLDPGGHRTLYEKISAEVIAPGIVESSDEDDAPYSGGTADFIEEVLNDPLWSGQRMICDALDTYRYVTVRSCHAAGKSHTAARIVLAFLHRHPHSIVVTTAPTNRQVKNVLWRYINATAQRNRERLTGRVLQMSYEIAPDWYAIGFKASNENVDAMQGFHAKNILLVIDEAAGVPEQIFEAADAILTGEGASCLMIGNPTSPKGTFRDSFHKGRSHWHPVRISAYDTPNFTTFGVTEDDMLTGEWMTKIEGRDLPYPSLIDPAWVARQIDRHGADSAFIQSRINAEFPEDAGDTLVPLSLIEAMNESAGDLDDQMDGPFYVGVDVARFGSDESSVAIRRGPVLLGQASWGKLDTMETVARVQSIMQSYGIEKASAIIRPDVVGVGGGVADRLKELGYRVEGVNVGSASSDREKWPNLRHELWWQMRERFTEGRIAPVAGSSFDELMMSQLSDIRFGYRTGYTMPSIESKDEAKRRGVRSPDRAEAVMLAFATLPRAKRGLGVVRVGRTSGKW